MSLHQQKELVPRHFDAIASAYDWMTGANPGYKKHLRWSAERMGLRADARILDLCCGTGLSTQALCKTYARADVTGLDASAGMLARARRKSSLAAVRWAHGDASDPAAAGAAGPFDGILMAYGIRNIADPDRCLANLLELLAPGGVICFHEYSVRDSMLSRVVWNAVSTTVILPTAVLMTQRAALFRYLKKSVNEFDGVRDFENRLRSAGFTSVRSATMDGWQRGIVHSFLATRPVAT